MGKSEVEKLHTLSITMSGQGTETQPWNNRDEKEKTATGVATVSLSSGVEVFKNQVAGHMTNGQHYGMLKMQNKVLKPINKVSCGKTEINFYEELERTADPHLRELKNFVPRFYGTETISVDNNKQVECIVLDDITRDIKEPCILDIKIGRKTYDPFASYEKIIKEDQKYHETKRDLGFCIPGFQVHKIDSGRIRKFGKDYGKQLNRDTIRDALRIFLNEKSGLSRTLLLQLLACLWNIQNWARKQRKLRLYSSSLLLMYDARKLRHELYGGKNGEDELSPLPSSNPRTLMRSVSLSRPISGVNVDRQDCPKSGFSGQLTKDGPILQTIPSPTRNVEFSPVFSRKPIRSLKRMHSFQNNYDKDLQHMRDDYQCILDDLVSEKKHPLWAGVKMIDFAHTYFVDSKEPDFNFLQGVDNLVKIFEEFLADTNYKDRNFGQ